MKIHLIAVGKLKEKYLVQGIKEYAKRLTPYCQLEVVEIADEATPDKASRAEEVILKAKEGERILAKIKQNSFVIALDIKGKMLSSEELAVKIEKLALAGKSHLTFVIGGSLGLAPQVLERAQMRLSFSPMTFPHQLMRLILLEQVYRAFMINRGSPYHK